MSKSWIYNLRSQRIYLPLKDFETPFGIPFCHFLNKIIFETKLPKQIWVPKMLLIKCIQNLLLRNSLFFGVTNRFNAFFPCKYNLLFLIYSLYYICCQLFLFTESQLSWKNMTLLNIFCFRTKIIIYN